MQKLLGKRVVAVMLAVMMVLSCGAFSFAADDSAQTKSVLPTLAEAAKMEAPAAPAAMPAVMLNGEYVAFTDAAPTNVNGRIMVPFRTIFEAMGAEVAYDDATKEITATLGDKKIAFYASKADIAITEGTETSKVTMDVLPFIDSKSSRTYVSSRFVAESFGYSVGWDSANKTVIIVDFAPMVKEIASKFSVLGMMLDNSEYDMTASYKTTGDFGLKVALSEATMKSMTGSETAAKASASLSGKIDGITKGLNASVNMDMTADVKELMSALGVAGTPDEAYINELLKDLNMEIKMDDDAVYMNAAFLDYLLKDSVNAAEGQKVWYKVPLSTVDETYDALGIDFEGLMDSAMAVKDFEDYLNMFVGMMESNMTIDTYYDVCVGVALAEELAGDKAFTKSGNTYTLTLTDESVSKILASVDNSDESATIGDTDFDVKLTLNAPNKKMKSYTVSGNLNVTDLGKITLSADGTLYRTNMKMAISIPDTADIDMTITENVSKTSTAPDTKVPAADLVVDITTLQ